ncbi:conserved hypothetical protein, partial [Ricinus communis]
LQQRFEPFGGLEVNDDALAVALQRIGRIGWRIRPFDRNNLGTHIAQHHAAEWAGADAQQLNHFQTCQWTHVLPLNVMLRRKSPTNALVRLSNGLPREA